MTVYADGMLADPDPSMADLARLESQLEAFNQERTGICDARPLAFVLKRPDGEIYAGLYGHTWGGCCEIKIVWIAGSERGRGLGRNLIRSAEREARLRNCGQIVLTTHSFQAPGFYEKEGFERVATIEGSPAGHADILMVKRLVP